MENYLLTHAEKLLMDIFWDSGEPQTSVALIALLPERKNYIPVMIKSLLSKKMIKECGTVLYGKRYARSFLPTMTREEYTAKLALSINDQKNAIPRITAALINEFPDSEKASLIKQLERMMKDLKKNLQSEDV